VSKAKFDAALKDPELFGKRMEIIQEHITREFKVPVTIGMVLAYEGGGPLDFVVLGNMHPQDIQWAGSVADVMSTAKQEFLKAQQEQPTLADRLALVEPANDNLPNLPPQQQSQSMDLSGMPASLRKAIFDAASKGEITVVHSERLDSKDDTDED
jgi:hypothetical protein